MPITLDGTLGITTPALTVTGATVNTGGISTAGNLTFSSTGQRIIGDFSNATEATKVSFQTSTVNGNTVVNAIPNGTATVSGFRSFNNSDPTNASLAQFGMALAGTEARLQSSITGTGTYLPLTMYTGGSERMRIDTSGNVGIATTTPSSFGKFAVQGASTNRVFYADSLAQPVARYDDNSFVINGLTIRNTGITGSNQGIGLLFQLGASGTAVNAGVIQMRSEGDFSVAANQDAAMTFGTCLDGTATERMRIDSSGNVGIGTTSPTSTAGFTPRLQLTSSSSPALMITSTGTTQQNAVGTDGNGLYIESVGNATAANNNIIFRNTSTNSSFAGLERMRITSAGDVGIGTASPSNYSGYTTLTMNNATNGAAIDFKANGVIVSQYYGDAVGTYVGSQASTPLIFRTAATERMRIDSAGKVAIGTSTVSSNSYVVISNAATNSKLRLDGGSAQNGLTFAPVSTGSSFYLYSYPTGWSIYDETAGATRIVLDNSGNFFVGGTTQNTATAPVYSKTTTKAWFYGKFVGANSDYSPTTSHNISSFVRNAQGNVTINFTSAMVDANYAVVVGYNYGGANELIVSEIYSQSASAFTYSIGYQASASTITTYTYGISIAVFR